MTTRQRTITTVVLTGALLVGSLVSLPLLRPANAGISLGDILKVGGTVFIVSTYGKQINTFINGVLDQNQVKAVGASKVVPIFSVGQGAYIGAAQVMGTPENVDKVKLVIAVNIKSGNLSGSELIPVSTKKITKVFNRIPGVGVSAIIDLKI